ncbi:MAG: hypothetical protein ACR2KZ_18845 [Segetibacter sp.]
MDTKALVKKLQEIFAEINKGEKKYSKIWLSEIDLGGLYHAVNYVLRLKAVYTIHDVYDETLQIIKLLNEKAKDESKFIPRVSIYDINEKAQPQYDDIIIYEEAPAFA